MRVFYVISILCLLWMTACKETHTERPTKHAQISDIDRATQTMAQFKADTSADALNVVSEQNDLKSEAQILDLPRILDVHDDESLPKLFQATNRTLLSQYPSDDQRLPIRTQFVIRGIPKSKLDAFEERLWNLLHAHVPQPWELKKTSQLDKHDEVWGRLEIQFKKQTNRIKRVSKTAPMRAEYAYVLSMKFYGPKDLSMVWDGWHFEWQDEVPVSNEGSVDAQFWHHLTQAFPTFTAINPEQTAQWMRTQGLMPQVLSDGLKAVRMSSHQYYPHGCVLSLDAAGTKSAHSLRQLQSIYTPPQSLSISNIAAIYCAREATYIVAAETPVKLALYYQPTRATHAWKSLLTFQDAMTLDDVGLHIDDDLICLYTANRSQQQRGFEIQCLDRKTGLMKWQTRRLSGGLRGLGSDSEKIGVINDQAVFEISRDGNILTHQPIETSSRLRMRHSCQLQNRLMFMPGPGQFASWNFETSEFDWQVNVIESDFIHCGQNHTFIFSEVGGYLLAYDVQNQAPLWKYRTVSMPRDAWSYADNIYFLFDRAILVLERKTGQRVAQIPLPWLATGFIQNGHKLYLDSADAIYEWR